MLTATKAQVAPGKLLIGGQWMDSSDRKTFDTVNPASGEVLTQIAAGTREDVDRAVKAVKDVIG